MTIIKLTGSFDEIQNMDNAINGLPISKLSDAFHDDPLIGDNVPSLTMDINVDVQTARERLTKAGVMVAVKPQDDDVQLEAFYPV